MIYRILRYVIAILVGTAAYVGMDSLAPLNLNLLGTCH